MTDRLDVLKSLEPFWGQWNLGDELGSGSTSRVYRIFNTKTKEKAALKYIYIPISTDGSFKTDEDRVLFREQRENEVREEFEIAHKFISHPNIIHYEELFVNSGEDGLDVLIRMEESIPIKRYLNINGMTEQQIVRLGIDMCKALIALHNLNILHRDVKPDNIFFNGQNYKLGDFSSSHYLSAAQKGLRGSLSTMAPEAISGTVDYRSDIYNLGMTMYLLLNQFHSPFVPKGSMDEKEWEAALMKRLTDDHLPKPARGSKKLIRIILRACNKNPDDRYQTVSEMRTELEQCLSSAGKKVILEAPSEGTASIFNHTVLLNGGASIPEIDYLRGIRTFAFAGEGQWQSTGDTREATPNTPWFKSQATKNVGTWVIYSVILSLIPLLVYVLLSWLRSDVSVNAALLHELSYLPVVLLTAALKDLLLSDTKKLHHDRYKALLCMLSIPLALFALLFLVIIFSESTSSIEELKYNTCLHIAFGECIFSFVVGIVSEYLEDI